MWAVGSCARQRPLMRHSVRTGTVQPDKRNAIWMLTWLRLANKLAMQHKLVTAKENWYCWAMHMTAQLRNQKAGQGKCSERETGLHPATQRGSLLLLHRPGLRSGPGCSGAPTNQRWQLAKASVAATSKPAKKYLPQACQATGSHVWAHWRQRKEETVLWLPLYAGLPSCAPFVRAWLGVRSPKPKG